MQVTATVESFAGKDDAIASIRQAHWTCGETDFGGLLALYNSGHTINISDKNTSEAFIVDVDMPKPPSGPLFERLPAEEREARMREYEPALDDYKKRVVSLDDPAYLAAVSGKIGAEYGVCLQSFSRDPLRRKVFFKIQFRRNIQGGDGPDGGRDLEGRRLRELFEQATGIKADPKMDRAAQVTFGCRISDACPINVSAWTPRPQPANADYGSTAAERKKTAQNISKSAGSQTSPPTDAPFQFVPLNMGMYNRKYGKSRRDLPRLEWQIHFYTHSERKIKNIREGVRHRTIPRLISSIVWNALLLNSLKWGPFSDDPDPLETGGYGRARIPFSPFTLKDCLGTLKKVILMQFDAGNAFWDEEGADACALLASTWGEFASAALSDTYRTLCARSHEKERAAYIPRDADIPRDFAYRAANFRACHTYAEVKELALTMARGDVKDARAYLRLCRQDPSIVKGRPGRQAGYTDYLKGCPQDKDGRYIVDPAHYHRKAFRDFCKDYNYRIRKATM